MSNIRYYLLLTANPLSDSKAAKQIFSTIKQLDILSRDLKIFMPGFHGNEYKEQDSVSVVTEKINSMVEHNKDNHGDYHGSNAVYHTYCPSAGDMYFNDADFAQFMLDLEDRCPNFEYLGKTEMVLLPTHKGIILYDKVKCFNLEPFFEVQRNNSLEEFLMSSLRILLKGENRTSLSCMDEIEHLYNKKVDAEVEDDTSTVSIRIDNWILKHMNWKEHDEAFFISYSTKDEYDAFALKALLEKNGKQVWIAPDGIPSGFDYAQAIPAALRITTRFIVLLSHNSANSGWVRREIDRAINNNKRIDGIFLKDFDVNLVNQYDHLSFLLCNNQLKYHINDLFNQGCELSKLLN